MAKRKPQDQPAGSPAWMSTFSDLMNLLLCFFVLLFSMSSVDAEKFEKVAASLSASFSIFPSGGSALSDEGILVGSGATQLNDLSSYYNNMGLNTDGEFTEEVKTAKEQMDKEGLKESESMADEIESALKAANVDNQVEITATNKYVMLNMNGGILFNSGEADLTPEAVSLLDSVAGAIYQYNDNYITIEGHTDSNPINTAKFPDNMMLSVHRAHSVYNYLVNNKGFDAKTMTSSGRGENVPGGKFMKKSMLNVITLALVLVNLVLTVILTFSLVSTNNKTNKLVTKVSEIIDLDVAGVDNSSKSTSAGTSIEDVAYVDVSNNGSNDIMISYTDGGKTHYAIVNVTLGLNTKAKDYASKSTTINNGMKVIVNAVQTEAMKYTYSTIAASKTTVESNLLATLQDTFQTECITSVIVSVVVQ